MAPTHAKFQIFIPANLYFYKTFTMETKTRNQPRATGLLCGYFIKVKTTTSPKRRLLSGHKRGRLI